MVQPAIIIRTGHSVERHVSCQRAIAASKRQSSKRRTTASKLFRRLNSVLPVGRKSITNGPLPVVYILCARYLYATVYAYRAEAYNPTRGPRVSGRWAGPIRSGIVRWGLVNTLLEQTCLQLRQGNEAAFNRVGTSALRSVAGAATGENCHRPGLHDAPERQQTNAR